MGDMGLWVKFCVNYELTQSAAAPEGYACDCINRDIKGVSVVEVVV